MVFAERGKKKLTQKEVPMRYVDGYVIPVPKKNLKTYARMAKMGAKMWMKHGALDISRTRMGTCGK